VAHWLGKDNELPSSSNLTTVALGPWWLSPNAEPFGAMLNSRASSRHVKQPVDSGLDATIFIAGWLAK